MSKHSTKKTFSKPLWAIEPTLYKKMIDILQQQNIHPFDIQTSVMKDKDGLDIQVKYGDTFSQSTSIHLDTVMDEEQEKKAIAFFEQLAEKCKSQLVSDYYKMVKPLYLKGECDDVIH